MIWVLAIGLIALTYYVENLQERIKNLENKKC